MAAVRGPGGRFLSKAERQALQSDNTDSNTITEENDNMSATELSSTDTTEIEFVDELPKIERKVEGGVWVERLAPLREHPGRWAKVYGPTKNPHALVNNLRGGSAAGIDPDEFQFSGRNLTDDDGEKQGYVFAKFLTEDERAERDAEAEAAESMDEDE